MKEAVPKGRTYSSAVGHSCTWVTLLIAPILMFAIGCPPPKDYSIEFYKDSKRTRVYGLSTGAEHGGLEIRGFLSLANVAVLRYELSTHGITDSVNEIDYDRTTLKASITHLGTSKPSPDSARPSSRLLYSGHVNSDGKKHGYACAFPISEMMRYSNSNRVDPLRICLALDSLVFKNGRAVYIDSICGVVFE